jgi:uncharacterized protein with HEPN domain
VRRDVTVFLDDIIEACDKISRYTSGFTVEKFRRDDKTIDAVVRNLEIIGEAAKNVPDEMRAKIAVDWKRMAGLRDVLIHEYSESISKSSGISSRTRSPRSAAKFRHM